MANRGYRDYIGLFLTGLSQVMFVAMSTYLVAHGLYLASFVSNFMVSLIWTLNVKKAAFGNWGHRFSYATGAATGTMIGMLIVHTIYK